MKKAKKPDAIAEYRRLLKTCERQYMRLAEYLATNPDKELPEKNRATARRLLRDTTQAGNAVRLSIAAKNAGLADELRTRQATFTDDGTRLFSKMDSPSAFLLAVCATITLDALDDILGLLKGERRPRYPKDAESIKVLEEAARRKTRAKYAGATNLSIALSLLLQENTDEYWRIMLRPKTKGVAAPARDLAKHNRRTSFVAACAKNWGGYLSAYLLDHKGT